MDDLMENEHFPKQDPQQNNERCAVHDSEVPSDTYMDGAIRVKLEHGMTDACLACDYPSSIVKLEPEGPPVCITDHEQGCPILPAIDIKPRFDMGTLCLLHDKVIKTERVGTDYTTESCEEFVTMTHNPRDSTKRKRSTSLDSCRATEDIHDATRATKRQKTSPRDRNYLDVHQDHETTGACACHQSASEASDTSLDTDLTYDCTNPAPQQTIDTEDTQRCSPGNLDPAISNESSHNTPFNGTPIADFGKIILTGNSALSEEGRPTDEKVTAGKLSKFGFMQANRLSAEICSSYEDLPLDTRIQNQLEHFSRKRIVRCNSCGKLIQWQTVRVHMTALHKDIWKAAFNESVLKVDTSPSRRKTNMYELTSREIIHRKSLATEKFISMDIPQKQIEQNRLEDNAQKLLVRCNFCRKLVRRQAVAGHMSTYHRNACKAAMDECLLVARKPSNDQPKATENQVMNRDQKEVDSMPAKIATKRRHSMGYQLIQARKLAVLRFYTLKNLPADVCEENQLEGDTRKHTVLCNCCGNLKSKQSMKVHMAACHSDVWRPAVKESLQIIGKPTKTRKNKDKTFLCTECKGTRMTSLIEKVEHCEYHHPGVKTHYCSSIMTSFLSLLGKAPCKNQFQMVHLMKNHLGVAPYSRKPTKHVMSFIECPICSQIVHAIHHHMMTHVSMLFAAKRRGVFFCTYCHREHPNCSLATVHHCSHQHPCSTDDPSRNTACASGSVTLTKPYPVQQSLPDIVSHLDGSTDEPNSDDQHDPEHLVGSEEHFLKQHTKMIDGWEIILRHFKGQHTCSQCGESFETEDDLREHVTRAMCSGQVFRCDECPTMCSSYTDLTQHVRSNHYIKAHEKSECNICGVKIRNTSMQRHILAIHSNEPVYKCPLCSERFYKTKDRRQHAAAVHGHAEEKPVHVCHICGYKSSNSECFKGHMNKHTGDTVKCSYCDATFSHPVSKYRHEKKHKGVEKVTCPQCPATFVQRASLNRHMKTHENIRYACDICGKTYSQTHPIMQHRKKKHPEAREMTPNELVVRNIPSST